jgi:hypothetical protein
MSTVTRRLVLVLNPVSSVAVSVMVVVPVWFSVGVRFRLHCP